MIVVDRAKLKFLLAGRTVEVEVPREYRKGRSYAIGTSHRRSVCRVLVVDSEECESGFRLTVKQATTDSPRLLAADPGAMRADYTNDPAKAARGEPEALTDAQLRHLTKFRPAHDHAGRVAGVIELRDRLVAELDEALRTTSAGRDAKDKLRAARHHLRRIEAA